MTALVTAQARSPWRVRVECDGVVANQLVPATYTIARADGLPTDAAAARVLSLDARIVELALGAPLLVGYDYVVSVTGATGTATVAVPIAPPATDVRLASDDPEAELFGVDLDWLADNLTPDGLVPEVRGPTCLRDDLVAIALTERGELAHRPDDGLGLGVRVNAPSDPGGARSAATRQWQRDDRVARLTVTATQQTTGELSIVGEITPKALPESVKVTVVT